jgi:hypothetical protein
MSDPLGPTLADFIYRFCPSVQHLEALLHIQAHPDRAWTPRELAGGLQGLSRDEAWDLLATFYGHGFLTAGSRDTFRYEPSSSELAQGVAALAKAYAEQRIVVLGHLTRLAALDPIRSFADAFVIRKDRKRG